MHLGEAEERDGNYFGPAVNQTARVMGVAHGGQCVLTDGVRDAAGITATNLGTHTLRDIETPVHLSQLGTEAFPPLGSVGTGIVSLPSPRTSLVGREAEVEEVRKLVGAHRLVTLTGVGGCGKTRLAIEVAYREVSTHPDGVWFVDLSTIADEAALPGAFATALALEVVPGTAPIDQIAAYLAPREALVVVDNCEHMVEEVAEFLDVLLERSPRLRALATSRESLDVEGEFTWKVPSLQTGAHAPAVQLFRERAAAGATLNVDDTTTVLIGEIIERLDGIPLAIELAAARARTMELGELRDRLDDRFRLLSGGSRRSRQRQATLEGAVQWSYDLLTEPEQSMLQTLAVFQSGFSAADVAAVAEVRDHEATDFVDSLAAKSLVDVTRDSGGHLRRRLLETVRLFALSRLIDTGRADAARDRHLEHFLHDPVGGSYDRWLSLDATTRIGNEYENFRSAAVWARERGRPEATARIAAVVDEAGARRGELQLIFDALRHPADLEAQDRIMVHSALAWEFVFLGELEATEEAVQVALTVNEEHPCDFGIRAMSADAVRLGALGDHVGARQRFEAIHLIAHEHYGANVRALADFWLALDDVTTFRYADAVQRFDALMAVAPNFGYRHVIEANRAWALLAVGRVDDAGRAVAELSEIPAASQWEHVNLVFSHAVMAQTVGTQEAARSLAAAAKALAARRPTIGSFILSGFAYIAHVRGDEQRAQEITSMTVSTHGEQLWNLLVLKPLGATPENFDQVRAAYENEHPIAERASLDAQHGRRLLNEELDRWS